MNPGTSESDQGRIGTEEDRIALARDLIAALAAAAELEVRVIVWSDAGGVVRLRGEPKGVLPPEHAAALGAAKPELWHLLAPPPDDERRRCEEAAGGTTTMRRAYPVCYPFSVTLPGGCRGETDEAASKAFGALAVALGWQDWARGQAGEGRHGRDVYCARAWAWVNEVFTGARWLVDEWGFSVTRTETDAPQEQAA
jgi:hypothetical protein